MLATTAAKARLTRPITLGRAFLATPAWPKYGKPGQPLLGQALPPATTARPKSGKPGQTLQARLSQLPRLGQSMVSPANHY